LPSDLKRVYTILGFADYPNERIDFLKKFIHVNFEKKKKSSLFAWAFKKGYLDEQECKAYYNKIKK
jgi:hypothetical protein